MNFIFKKINFLYIFLFILLFFALIFFYQQNLQLKSRTAPIEILTPSPAPIEEVNKNEKTVIDSDKQYFKRYFSPGDPFFGNQEPPPAELINLKDEELIAFASGPTFYKQANGNYEYFLGLKGAPIRLENGIALIFLANREQIEKSKNANSLIFSTNIYQIEDERNLLMYGIKQDGLSTRSDIYLGFLNPDATISATAQISKEKGDYFSCSDLLAIKTDNTAYISCYSGKSGGNTRSIYKVDLNKDSSAALLLRCYTTSADPQSGKINYQCGTTL